jgi:hypothetical protein
VLLFALVASDSDFTIDLYTSREAAEEALRQVLADEPDFEELLSIEPLDFSGIRLTWKTLFMSESEFLTVKQASELLGITEKAVRQAEKERGAFPKAKREPRGKTVSLLIPRSDVDDYDRTRRRRTRSRRRTSPAAPARATSSRSTQAQLLWSPPERVGLLRAAFDVEEAPEDTKRIAVLLRQIADLVER